MKKTCKNCRFANSDSESMWCTQLRSDYWSVTPDTYCGCHEYKEHCWHDAESDDLPPIDEEVIALDKRGKICFAHRPDPNRSYIGKSVISGNKMKYKVMTYGKGKWNIPDVRWWMPCPKIPKENE